MANERLSCSDGCIANAAQRAGIAQFGQRFDIWLPIRRLGRALRHQKLPAAAATEI
jgi:hypothetical protein